jgi:hypothetical protein
VAHLYVLIIGFVAAVLFVIVDRFELERRYGHVLKFLIVCAAAATIVSKLIP